MSLRNHFVRCTQSQRNTEAHFEVQRSISGGVCHPGEGADSQTDVKISFIGFVRCNQRLNS